ncbi:YncE family protein [Raoultella ornithinolytica]|uniref:7-bladed beta-propeller protein YncE n=1 Tax=Raoultella ornithinolytica TaxID=54291 RepID=UPI0021AF76DC|nr:YncE family protein [Raoultella ornithinolytica]ELT0599064.1 YncE family protein [Raoultella ornithinolytica]ELT0730118.1 YncE family protein [Raoultella ornithinolytica]MCT4739028.1 YncE family protein [Raoultella ornithinolytica]
MSTVSLTKVTLCALAISSSLPVFSASAKDFTEQAFRSQPLGHGVYELAYDNSQKTLYAASAPSFEKDKTTGIVFRLAADSLQINQKIATERRTFALSLDEENHILYLGNALDGSLTLVDTLTNKVIKTIQLSDDADPEKQAHVREVVLDKQNQRLYVSGIGRKDKGLLWVVDTRKQQLSETLNHLEPVGFAVDDAGNKVYVVTGNGELVTLDGKTSKLLARVKVDPAEPDHYFLNIALNSAAGVGYIADTNTRDVLVVRLDSGKLVGRIASPNSVAVLYNAARDEIYVTHRNDRSISVIDAKTHHLKHAIKTAAMPNSLALSADAGTLYASVKQDEKSDQADYVLKIDLTKF